MLMSNFKLKTYRAQSKISPLGGSMKPKYSVSTEYMIFKNITFRILLNVQVVS